MKLTKIQKIRYFLFPPKCAGCGQLLDLRADTNTGAGLVFCETCFAEWSEAKLKPCPCCGGFISGCRKPPKQIKNSYSDTYLRLVKYNSSRRSGAVNRFIYCLKHSDDKRLFEFAASELYTRLNVYLLENGISGSDIVFSYVPRRTSAVAENGVDHAQEIAGELSRLCGSDFHPGLVRRRGGREQKSLGRNERFGNMARSVYPGTDCGKYVAGHTVILIDDILTTGASMSAVADILLRAGASKIIYLTIAQTVNDTK